MTTKILVGDALKTLQTMPDESVHCVITSPPYWGLRDYGTAEWEGGDEGCDHEMKPDGGPKQLSNKGAAGHVHRDCKCGATRVDKQLGLEATPEEYIANMVAVFREVRRVLRSDGTLFCNMGDSYQDKQLVGMPWRLALALQADGWWLRSDIIWAKPNPMPESVTDRPTKSHEYVFLLTKSARYFYDNDAVREGLAPISHAQIKLSERGVYDAGGNTKGLGRLQDGDRRLQASGASSRGAAMNPAGRNRRSVWTIATQAFSAAHFATFPTALVEPMIKAGTSEKGCCPECAAPWERVVEKIGKSLPVSERHGRTGHNGQPPQISGMYWSGPTTQTTNEWRPTCDHDRAPIPCTVLDPFAGACTVGLVADRLGRDSIMMELNPEYAAMGEQRINNDAGWVADVEVEEQALRQLELL